MFIRFQAALLLVVATAVAGSALEKDSLSLRREIGRQYYQSELLRERVASLRLSVEELGAPSRLLQPFQHGRLAEDGGILPRPITQAGPLLWWRAPQ